MSDNRPVEQPTAIAGARQAAIADLDLIVAALPPAQQAVFRRLFHISVTEGSLVPPDEMRPWITKLFGSVEATLHQRIVKVTNLTTFEGSLFNELRARRPIESRITENLIEEVEKSKGDPFCRPEQGTPADVFGRVRGKLSVTASNIAKYDGFHGVIIFTEHDPYHFSAESVVDAVDTALEWGRRAHAVDPAARYFFFMWNCLWKSGASIIHGHAQVSLSRDMHYARVEHLRRVALDYRRRYDADYFSDLYRAHQAVGTGFQIGSVRAMAYLTPIKEKEILLVSDRLDDAMKKAVYAALECYRQRLGVTAFNLVLYMPPIAPADEDWSHFPIVARLVDRGEPMNRTNDMGAMELYASSVIASDPFHVARVLQSCMGEMLGER
ncbi:MAG: hypothetical protein HY331_01025 [Chloroflexi bacterium]|nr:hypothetical protein [Chloroflexota bacterium]